MLVICGILLGIGIFAGCMLLILLCINYFYNPFRFPYIVIKLDVSRKRLPTIEDQLDRYLNQHGMSFINTHLKDIDVWKIQSEQEIQKSVFQKHRRQQYESVLEDSCIIKVELVRQQTRYRQSNYQRYAYQTENIVSVQKYSYQDIESRYEQLCKIGNACTLKEYFSHNQRKLMTPALRKKIMERDHYTCQMCGKYMPDEVGLQIDHIIPVAKGGKTVPDNLQVLCSKCNGKKKDKVLPTINRKEDV